MGAWLCNGQLSMHVRASNVATGLCACKTLHAVSKDDYNGVKKNT